MVILTILHNPNYN